LVDIHIWPNQLAVAKNVVIKKFATLLAKFGKKMCLTPRVTKKIWQAAVVALN
jgi:hypothetical protein